MVLCFDFMFVLCSGPGIIMVVIMKQNFYSRVIIVGMLSVLLTQLQFPFDNLRIKFSRQPQNTAPFSSQVGDNLKLSGFKLQHNPS